MEYKVKAIVNGREILYRPGTRRFYIVIIRKNAYCHFETIKAAAAFCETFSGMAQIKYSGKAPSARNPFAAI